MMFRWWMVWRLMRSPKQWLSVTTILSLLGMTIGVGSLVVAMAVISGYETTLKKSVIDVFGELMLIRRAASEPNVPNNLSEVTPQLEGFVAQTPFVYVEAIIASKGKVAGVLLEGIDPEQAFKVINIKNKLMVGSFDFQAVDGVPGAVIGAGVAKKFSLQVGDSFRLVTPVMGDSSGQNFRPRMKVFRVVGVVNLGRHDYDLRYVLSDLKTAQDFAQIGENVSGFRLKFKNSELALSNNIKVTNQFGHQFWTRDWVEVNRNLFEAVRLEKRVIFFVLLIIVVAACFNISSNLFLSVMRRFHEISILKAVGADRKFLMGLFRGQALLIGAVGSLFGICLGLMACYGFLLAQDHLGLWPAEIYKLTRISVELRWLDLLSILGAALIICYLATRIPARRGADLSPVEGLRYE